MNNRSGKIGEDYAARYLSDNGFTILERNYHSRWGEVDIIAQKDPYISFVEVKTRRISSAISPLEMVTKSKQKKIIETTRRYLGDHPELAQYQPRFDVCGLWVDEDDTTVLQVEYLPGAFWEGW
jgi:putative endonuclease